MNVKICQHCKKAPKGKSWSAGLKIISCSFYGSRFVGDSITEAIERWNAKQ